MKCMVCFQKREMNCTYKGIIVCSEGCYIHLEQIGIGKLIIGKEEQLKRYKRFVQMLQVEKDCEDLIFGEDKEKAIREIDRSIKDARENMLVIKNHIDLLKKHPEVRLQHLF
ncbi:hypothetical protein [Bacillus luti]|uniref:hypothetical protein n=1 Tax=Bacillus luti TaxID=2026191 RepID=UPI0012E77D13|nr:hypothetical protein [Bacillus luti]